MGLFAVSPAEGNGLQDNMAPDASISEGAGALDAPTQRFTVAGVGETGERAGAAEPKASLVHVKAAEPPSIWNAPNVITMARVIAIPVGFLYCFEDTCR